MNLKQFVVIALLAVLLAGCVGQKEVPPEQAAADWEAKAESYTRAYKYEEASEAWEKAGEAWEAAGNSERAKKAFLNAGLLWELIATLYEGEEKWEKAAEAWEKAAEIYDAHGFHTFAESARESARAAREAA